MKRNRSLLPQFAHRSTIGFGRGLVLSLFLVAAAAERAAGADWPTYRADNRRSGITAESLALPLVVEWDYNSTTPPQTAWPGPAKWDSYANITRLESMRNFDPAFFVTVVGDAVYFGSSVDDAVHCLQAKTGQEQWVFHANGPVRLPPSWHKGKVYFGADDGYAYCLDAAKGTCVWKVKPSPAEKLLLSNGKLISHWPCRTGVVIQGDLAYFGASLVPWEESYLCAVDAVTGNRNGAGRYQAKLEHLTMQGALLATETHLYLPQGRQKPEMFDRATGRALGGFGGSGEGGVYAVVTESDEFLHGRGQHHGSTGELRGFDAKNRDYFVTLPRARLIVVQGDIAYLNTGTEIAAFARGRYVEIAKHQTQLQNQQNELKESLKKLRGKADGPEGDKIKEALKPLQAELDTIPPKLDACYLWKTPTDYPHDLILAGQTLFAGGDDRIAAFDCATGKELWSAPVKGRAHGLAIANGRLFVSTDRGAIQTFGSSAAHDKARKE